MIPAIVFTMESPVRFQKYLCPISRDNDLIDLTVAWA